MYHSMSYSLHSVLISSNSSKPDISVAQWKVIVASIVAGLSYLHEKCGILHNDLKEDNNYCTTRTRNWENKWRKN